MSFRTLIGSIALVAITAGVTALVGARPQDPTQMSPEDMAKTMADFMKAGEPGEQHEALADLAGEWDSDNTTYMGPTAQKSKSTSSYESVLGGRYVIQRTSGTMAGMKFEGLGILGYDNIAKEYISVWMDSMGTGMSMTTGNEDQAGWVEMKGIMKDAMSPQGRPWRTRTKNETKDKVLLEIYDSMSDGKGGFTELKIMDSVMTRKPANKGAR